jgi:hypothetical protein
VKKRVDLKVAPSRSTRGLLSVRAPDGSIAHLQELITAAGFEDGEMVSIVSTEDVERLRRLASGGSR